MRREKEHLEREPLVQLKEELHWLASKLEKGGRASVYILAGLATSPDFFRDVEAELKRRLSERYEAVEMRIFFPYGDWSRKLLPQLRDIGRDVLPSSGGRGGIRERRGGLAAARAIRDTYTEGALFLIGHSAGGTAAVYAAEYLLAEGIRVNAVIQIGSPKTPLPAPIRPLTSYLYRVGEDGRPADPVTRIGSWGGWSTYKGALPRWDPVKYAPARMVPLALTGGHADYFRSSAPYRDAEGRSNLERTADAVAAWLLAME
ncbi:thioesterase domain-containing protein [Paenibacillus gansuensis]|uniref:Thioesterase domain-containing protein n=1 Tax=Paenibacillus gansuensis TaxID=306542 RepID=A0ABW5PFE8_9BACL